MRRRKRGAPRKPTSPYGWIAFGKDGTVQPDIRNLPDDKPGQERFVAGEFAKQVAGSGILSVVRVDQLDENNHDFQLVADGDQHIIVQMTEVVWRDYASPLSQDDFMSGNFSGIVILSEPEKRLIADEQKLKETLVEKLTLKVAKNYQKPKEKQLWLLMWTVRSEFIPFYNEGGQAKTHACVDRVKSYVEQNGLGPFDQVWFINLSAPMPHRLA